MDIYYKNIKHKYNISKAFYDSKLSIDQYQKYLYYFDIMNTYSLFPTIIDFNINKQNNFDINNIINNMSSITIDSNISSSNKFILNIKKLIDKFRKLVNSDDRKKEISEAYNKSEKSSAIRRFFSYELLDELTTNYKGENVTTAWVKCYEILKHYNLFEESKNNTINCFFICEQPGAFIYATNHYVKEELSKKFDFILQSLNSNIVSDAFKPDSFLYKQYKNKYDYGIDSMGDVTDVQNIIYYRNKYINKNFDLITADCGIDCSDDFSQQESNSLDLIIGQIIMAIGLSNYGSNYFFKLFTIYEELTKQFIFLLSLLFKNVIICRTLATKITSGEIYCVCKHFNFSKNQTNTLFNQLCQWYMLFKNNNNINLLIPNVINNVFYDDIHKINKLLFYRRIINMRYIYFKNNNYTLTIKNPKVVEYINKLVNHYVGYFISLYNIKALNDSHKLVNHFFKVKWIPKQKRQSYELKDELYIKYLYPIYPIFNNDNYMYYLHGNNHTMEYIFNGKKLNITFKETNNDPDIKSIKNKINLVMRKSRNILTNITNKFYNLYTKYKYLLTMYYSVKFLKDNNKLDDLIIINFIYKELSSYNLSNKSNMDYIKKKLDMSVQYFPITDFQLKNIPFKKAIYYLSHSISNTHFYNNINVYTLLINNLCMLLKNIKNGSSIILYTSFNNYLFFDIVNFFSQYFKKTYIKKYKYEYSVSIFVIFQQKITNNVHSLELDDKTVYRLYRHKIDKKYIDFIENITDEYVNTFMIHMNILSMKINDDPRIDLIKENIDIHKYMCDYLFKRNKL